MVRVNFLRARTITFGIQVRQARYGTASSSTPSGMHHHHTMKTMIIAQQRFVAAATRKPLNSLAALPHRHSQLGHRVAKAKASSIPSPTPTTSPTAVDDDDATATTLSTVSQQQRQQHEQLLLHIDRHHVLHPYTSMTSPIPTHLIQSARGIHLQLHNGKQFIDGMSSPA